MAFSDWERIEPLLGRLLQLPEEERRAFLARECRGEPELAQRLLAIVAEELSEERFLEPPSPSGPSGPGTRVGRYALRRELGRGGMGEVWLAERADGEFEQRVALKLIHRGLGTDELLRRFRAERQVLAWLHHPGIARLVDGGVCDDGRPYLAMEYVEGVPIDRYWVDRGLSLRERLELFAEVCDAVQHAHEHGVVHRDVKPGNVLVDARGRSKLLDFGIAKVLGAEDELQTVELTQTGQRLYSPLYASPEQVLGKPVTAATDVYSLGVLLCELLSGRRPYDARATSQLELERIVCGTSPQRPSELAAPETRGALRGNLDWIVGMALRKEPERRYENAGALRDDLRRHLASEPVLARPDSLAYRARTFALRNRAFVGGALGVFLALTAGMAASLWLWRAAAASERESRWSAYSAGLQSAEAALRQGAVGVAAAQLEGTPEELRGWEWRHLVARLDRSLRAMPVDGSVSHATLAVSPNGTSLAVRYEGSLRLHDVVGGMLRRQIAVSVAARDAEIDFVPWSSVDYHPDGASLATGGRDGRLRVLDAQDLTALQEVDLAWCHLYSAVYDPSGRWLACGLRSGEVVVLEHPGYREVARWQAHGPGDLDLEFSDDGRWLASASWDDRVRLWSVPDFQLARDLLGHERHVTDLAFAAGDTLLVSTSIDGTARVWTLDDPAPPSIVRAHGAPVDSVAVHPDGRTAFTGGGNGTILRWDLRTGEVVAELRGHRERVHSLVVTLAADRLFSASPESLRLWRLDTEDVTVLAGCEYQSELVLHPFGTELAVAGPDGRVRRWSLPGLRPLAPLEGGAAGQCALAYRDSGERLVAADVQGALWCWRLPDGRLETEVPPPARPPIGYGMDARDGLVFVLTDDRFLVRRALVGGEELGRVPLPAGMHIGHYAKYVDAKGDLLVGDVSGTVWRIDPVTGDGRAELHEEQLPIVLADRGDELLVACGPKVSLWRASVLRWRRDLGDARYSAAFHPIEPRVAVGLNTGLVEVLDAESGRRLVSLDGHTDWPGTVRFSADGASLYTCSMDGTVRVWTAPTE